MITAAVRRQFTITRILDAPRELVFDSWTKPDHLQWWLGPYRRSAPDLTMDVRPGGRFQVKVIQDEVGNSHISGGIYHEIVPREKLVSWGFPADDVATAPPITVRLNDLGDRTEMIFHLHLPGLITDAAAQTWLDAGIRAGWTQTLDRLAAQWTNGDRLTIDKNDATEGHDHDNDDPDLGSRDATGGIDAGVAAGPR